MEGRIATDLFAAAITDMQLLALLQRGNSLHFRTFLFRHVTVLKSNLEEILNGRSYGRSPARLTRA